MHLCAAWRFTLTALVFVRAEKSSTVAGEIGSPMNFAWELWREQGADALWERCLGFLDRSAEETVARQRQQLERQLLRQGSSPLTSDRAEGRRVDSVDSLRSYVPLSDYRSYVETLGARDDTVLVAPPDRWIKTSGRFDGGTKWIPVSSEARSELAWATLGLFIAARARGRGDVRLPRELRLLNMTAPPPYFSGTAIASFEEARLWRTRLYPQNDPAVDALPFEERMALGFTGAARRGVDFAISYSSVLAGVGGTVSRRGLSSPARSDVRQRGRLLWREVSAWFQHRSLLPRDIWGPKAIIAGGMDAALFRSQIMEQWGAAPLELFGSTEGLFMGMQTWDRTTISLIPDFNFYEFIPSEELSREESDPGYEPRTLLLDELSANGSYELVVTSLLGGALQRYRTGELLRLASTSNLDAGIALPQFSYQGQRSDLVEVAGFARLSEETFARALAHARIESIGWTVRKEIDGERPVVHLRLELAVPEDLSTLSARVNEALRRLDEDWRDMEDFADIHPLRVTVLRPGTFARWRAISGEDRLPLPRINASASVIAGLEVAERHLVAAEA